MKSLIFILVLSVSALAALVLAEQQIKSQQAFCLSDCFGSTVANSFQAKAYSLSSASSMRRDGNGFWYSNFVMEGKPTEVAFTLVMGLNGHLEDVLYEPWFFDQYVSGSQRIEENIKCAATTSII